jgi:hypothetical protein
MERMLKTRFSNKYVVSEICPGMFNISSTSLDPYRIFVVITLANDLYHLLFRIDDSYDVDDYAVLDVALDAIDEYFIERT